VIILGLDQAIRKTGYCIFNSSQEKPEDAGEFFPRKKVSTFIKIEDTIDFIFEKVSDCKVDEIAIEDVFYRFNVQVVKDLSRLRGALEDRWFRKKKKLVYSYTASEVRPTFGLKGNCHKVETQVAVCKRYTFLSSSAVARFYEQIADVRDDQDLFIGALKRTLKNENPSKERKQEVKMYIKVKRASTKKLLTLLSRAVEKESGISEHTADAIVIGAHHLRTLK